MKRYNNIPNNVFLPYNPNYINQCCHKNKRPNTVYSLFEVEHFICDIQKICKTMNFIKLFR